jgi:hypothetical protein
MPIYSPKQTGQTVVNFAHPSVDGLKDKPLVITPHRRDTYSPYNSGMMSFSKNIFYDLAFPRSSIAPNSARLNKDIKLGNIECIDLDEDEDTYTFKSLAESPIPLPEFDQQGSDVCQLISCLTAVQQHVHFPIDWGQFFKCIPTFWSSHDIFQNPKLYDEQKVVLTDLLNDYGVNTPGFKEHLKLINALFSEQCLPISPAMPGITNCADGKYPISHYHGTAKSDDGCTESCNPDTIGIRILPKLVKNEITISTAKQLHQLRKKYGPRPIPLAGKDLIKLEIITKAIDLGVTTDGGAMWDRLSKLNDKDLKDELMQLILRANPNLPIDKAEEMIQQIAMSGHAITLIDSNGPDANGAYKLTLRNSWQGSKDINITWNGPADLAIDEPRFPNWFRHSNIEKLKKTNRAEYKYLYHSIVYKVEACQPNIKIKSSEDCKKQNCKDLGYDSDDPQAKDTDCPCKCSEGTNNIGRLIQRTYCKNCTKCECPTDPLIICGPNYDPKTQKVNNCDCECIYPSPRRTFRAFQQLNHCSGSYSSQVDYSSYNLVTVTSENMKLL